MALRLLSGLAGALILLISGLTTLGISLAAPLGMLAARSVARRKNRTSTRGTSWLAAIGASSLAVALWFVAVLVFTPNAWREVARETQASARDTVQLPSWFSRVFPQAARRPDPMTERVVNSPVVTTYFGLVGAALACVVLGAVLGSVGWLGTLLLGFAVRGGRHSGPVPAG